MTCLACKRPAIPAGYPDQWLHYREQIPWVATRRIVRKASNYTGDENSRGMGGEQEVHGDEIDRYFLCET